MKIKVWIVTTCIPERGETEPCLPSVFGTEAEAEAYADEMLRNEWASHAEWNDEGTEQKPYPGDWREANDILEEENGDGSWGEWQITSHEIEIGAAGALTDNEYLSRFPPEARPHADRAYQDGYEDGANSESTAVKPLEWESDEEEDNASFAYCLYGSYRAGDDGSLILVSSAGGDLYHSTIAENLGSREAAMAHADAHHVAMIHDELTEATDDAAAFDP